MQQDFQNLLKESEEVGQIYDGEIQQLKEKVQKLREVIAKYQAGDAKGAEKKLRKMIDKQE